MSFVSSKHKQIEAELQSHLNDLVDELVLEKKLSVEEARSQASQVFGDLNTHVQAVEKVYPLSRIFRFGIGPTVVISFTALSVVFSLMYAIFENSIAGTRMEPALLWWVFVGIIGFALLLNQWIIEFHGLRTPRVLISSFLFTGMLALSITRVMDVNNFEEVIHAILIGVVVLAAAEIWWKKISILGRQLIAQVFCAVVVWSVLVQQPLLGFVGQAQCLYVRPGSIDLSGALNVCQQVPWMSTLLLPIYILAFIGIPYLLVLMYQYVTSRGTTVYRKIILTGFMLVLPIAPAFAHDINSLGQLDIIPWKREIFSAYREALGRKPQEKDIEFYAQTKAYTDMDHVRTVLFASYERSLKIRLVYVEELGREPTEEELQFFIAGEQSIKVIRKAIR